MDIIQYLCYFLLTKDISNKVKLKKYTHFLPPILEIFFLNPTFADVGRESIWSLQKSLHFWILSFFSATNSLILSSTFLIFSLYYSSSSVGVTSAITLSMALFKAVFFSSFCDTVELVQYVHAFSFHFTVKYEIDDNSTVINNE